MVEDSLHSSSSDESSAIHESLVRWVDEGAPSLKSLLDSLWVEDLIEDPMLKIMIFGVIGNYGVSLADKYAETNDVTLSHSLALSTVMSNPQVSALVDKFMGDMVSSQVEGLI
tara:strand:- start:2971 stop:3309 length:339 start_codon:yes stop_codon:yes gene_type:complete